MTTERYRLSISGTVTYSPDNADLRDLLLAENANMLRIPEALQELEKEATDVKVTLEKIS